MNVVMLLQYTHPNYGVIDMSPILCPSCFVDVNSMSPLPSASRIIEEAVSHATAKLRMASELLLARLRPRNGLRKADDESASQLRKVKRAKWSEVHK